MYFRNSDKNNQPATELNHSADKAGVRSRNMLAANYTLRNKSVRERSNSGVTSESHRVLNSIRVQARTGLMEKQERGNQANSKQKQAQLKCVREYTQHYELKARTSQRRRRASHCKAYIRASEGKLSVTAGKRPWVLDRGYYYNREEAKIRMVDRETEGDRTEGILPSQLRAVFKRIGVAKSLSY